MQDTTLTIILAAIPPTLVALAGVIVSIVNSVKANRIHVLVNSNLQAVKSDLEASKQRVDKLQQIIGDMAGSKGTVEVVAAAPVPEKGEKKK